jgi:hypothetical protein
VESPAKAKKIAGYLGPGATVLATYGHVRDLPAKAGSVSPEAGFAMAWESAPRAKAAVAAIVAAATRASEVVLATDPDREGEAISWHILEELKVREKKKKKNAWGGAHFFFSSSPVALFLSRPARPASLSFFFLQGTQRHPRRHARPPGHLHIRHQGRRHGRPGGPARAGPTPRPCVLCSPGARLPVWFLPLPAPVA